MREEKRDPERDKDRYKREKERERIERERQVCTVRTHGNGGIQSQRHFKKRARIKEKERMNRCSRCDVSATHPGRAGAAAVQHSCACFSSAGLQPFTISVPPAAASKKSQSSSVKALRKQLTDTSMLTSQRVDRVY